jgi:hypothetical protein
MTTIQKTVLVQLAKKQVWTRIKATPKYIDQKYRGTEYMISSNGRHLGRIFAWKGNKSARMEMRIHKNDLVVFTEGPRSAFVELCTNLDRFKLV